MPMTPTERELFDALHRIVKHGPQKRGGVCANIQHYLAPNKTAAVLLFQDMATEWEHYSGNLTYPIRGGIWPEWRHGRIKAARLDYERGYERERLWKNKNRWALVLWTIKQLEQKA